MTFSAWLKRFLGRNSAKPHRNQPARRLKNSKCFVPRLEQLEDRLAPASTITILDAGVGTLANLNSNGGDVNATAGTTVGGSLSARGILTAGSGNITLQATSVVGGSITQTGIASGQAISVTASNNITVDALRGTSVSLTSN